MTTAALDSDLSPWEEVTGRLKAIVSQLPSDWLVDGGDVNLAQLRRFVDQLIDKISPVGSFGGDSAATKDEIKLR